MAGRRRPQQHPNRNHYQHQQPPFIKYEAREEDELDLDLDLDEKTAQLLTPQVTINVAQRRKPLLNGQHSYEDVEASFGDESESGYDMDYAFMSDNSHGSASGDFKFDPSRQRQKSAKRPAQPQSPDGGNRPKKMYELDVTLYPEAAAARASYENRVRKKAEKERMMNQLNFLAERNRVLEEENAALKEKLLEYDSNVTAQDWFLFFRSAGIRSGDDRKYAAIFDANRIKPSLLLDLNEQWLREMDVTAVGDILAILKHAKLVHAKTNGRKLHFKSPPLLQMSPIPLAKKLPADPSSSKGILLKGGCTIND